MDTAVLGTANNGLQSQILPIAGSLRTGGDESQNPAAAREPGAGIQPGSESAVQILRQELRLAFKARFGVDFSAQQPAYAGNQPATGNDVANEALGVARQIVAQSPSVAAKAFIEFRAQVQESVSIARQSVTTPSAGAEIDQVAAQLEGDLAALEQETADNRISSSSVLEVDSATRQRTKIKILTQDGDVVKLSLRQVERLSASMTEQADGESSSSTTEIEFSSKTRMMMKVQGELDEGELAAIQSVIESAQDIADTFFNGDIGAAFEASQGFEFDSTELARVNMRFRMREVTNVSYTEIGTAPPVEETPVEPAIVAPVDTGTPVAPDAGEVGPEADKPLPEFVSTPPVVTEDDGADAPATDNPLGAFFELVGSFLRSTSESFGSGGDSSYRFQYSESVKLSLLQAVFQTVAPDDAQDAADAAVDVIGAISDSLPEQETA